MPNRILRDGILSSERVNSLTPGAELFYRRLMSVVDDYGRLEEHPSLILAACYPLQLSRVTTTDIVAWMTECSEAGLIQLYTVGNKRFLEVTDFRQRTRYPSKCPDPTNDRRTTVVRLTLDGLTSVCSQTLDGPKTDEVTPYSSRARTPPSPPSPPHSHPTTQAPPSASLAVATSEEDLRIDLFEEVMAAFSGLGHGGTLRDRMRCENAWKGLQIPQRLYARAYVARMLPDWQARPPSKVPRPWNFLEETHWERDTPRTLPVLVERKETLTISQRLGGGT